MRSRRFMGGETVGVWEKIAWISGGQGPEISSAYRVLSHKCGQAGSQASGSNLGESRCGERKQRLIRPAPESMHCCQLNSVVLRASDKCDSSDSARGPDCLGRGNEPAVPFTRRRRPASRSISSGRILHPPRRPSMSNLWNSSSHVHRSGTKGAADCITIERPDIFFTVVRG